MEKNIAALLREDARTVHVRFASGVDGFYTPSKLYTYVTDLQLDPEDYVVVYANERLKVACVSSIDDGCDIEPNSSIEYEWVVCKIDMRGYDQTMAKNRDITELVHEAYKNNLRRSFAMQLLSGVEDDKRLMLENLLKKG